MDSSTEHIIQVQVLDSGEILVALASGGHPSYQYIYRAARGVYWVEDPGAFVSRGRGDWSPSQWVVHIMAIVKEELNVVLRIAPDIQWIGMSDGERAAILASVQTG